MVRTTDTAQRIARAITIPMMFLAGIFFPIDQLPGWLHSIVQLLPLAPLLKMIRDIAFDTGSIFSEPKNMIIVGSWIIVCFAISVFKFKLTEE